MAHELDELIPIMNMHFALWNHRILFTHIPGNHDASEAYPLVDAPKIKGKKRKKSKLVAERKEKGKVKEKRKKSPQGPEARKPKSSWRKALEPLTFRIRISRYSDNLAETYAERKI